VGLLTGELVYGCFYDKAVWQRAFASVGLTLQQNQTHWIVTVAGKQPVMIDPVEVKKYMVGVAFLGISPLAIAVAVASYFEGQDPIKPDDSRP
jgi:hypothetical protein